MIFKYTYLERHHAEKLHKLVEHIVVDVWCKAKGKKFYLNRIDGEFRSIVAGTPKNLRKPIHEIYKICARFDQTQLDEIKKAFERNNGIEKLCKNEVTPVFYKGLEIKTSKQFVDKLRQFFAEFIHNFRSFAPV